MYARLLKKPSSSCLLLGPRGTGKSTWIRHNFPDAVRYDLLDSREAIRLERSPHLLYQELEALPKGTWAVIDEVQKVPALLDEVHRLIEGRGLRFVLCGSSARKLRRGGVNLLAGRAIVTHLFPLVSAELGKDFDSSRAVTSGTLPMALSGDDSAGFLETYATAYLDEEIRAEALTRNVGAFSRFLEIAARQNGQVTNVTNISREASVSRSTVQTYFDILQDTLIGNWLHAWKLKRATKQVGHPKFYFFDSGVARVLSGRLPYLPTQEELGPLLETLISNELRAYIAYRELRYKLYFWRTYEGVEVDFMCETREGYFALEVKAARDWRRQFNAGLNRIRKELEPAAVLCYGVYLGDRPIQVQGIRILPLPEFLKTLWAGEAIR